MNYSGPPVICRDVVILGSIISDGLGFYEGQKAPVPMAPGDVRAYDVRTGKLRWRFNTIPQEGEFGLETWKDESWKWVGGCNVWSIISVDEDLGYVYLPVTAPSSNYYGGFRPGDNLYGQSLVCLDVTTGKRVWHYQTIHHPAWDLDLPAAPNLVDITVDGKKIKAVAQISKTGFVYVFDRITGQPVWPIEERPVPTNGVPGEVLSPTQPFPTKPPAFERQGITDDDLIDFTPELKEAARKFISQYRTGPIFTPLSEEGTIMLPGIGGGGDWMGGSFDPETGIIYIMSKTLPFLIKLVKQDEDSRWPIAYREEITIPFNLNLPIVKPPWGRITAIDLHKGEIVWQKPNSDGIRYHPNLKAMNLPPTGNASKANTLLTKSILFMPVTGQYVYEPDGSMSSAKLRAFDKVTGDVLWEHPISPSYDDGGAPMTYLWKDRQYVVVPTGGGGATSHLVAFALRRDGDAETSDSLPPLPVMRKIPQEIQEKVTVAEAAGMAIFQQRCLGCHTMGYGPLAGPDLLGAHEKPRETLAAMVQLMRLNRGVAIHENETEPLLDFLQRPDAAALLYTK